jgi:methionine-rich copper-binding protein CopC
MTGRFMDGVMTTGRRWPVVIAAIVGFLSILAFSTSAYPYIPRVSLVSSDPAAESRVAHLPRELELHFSDTVNTAQVTLIDPAGGTIPLGTVTIRNDLVRTTVSVPDGPAGKYAVSYTTTSADGRAGNGSLSFTVITGVKASATKGGSKSPSPTAGATTAEVVATSAAAAPADFVSTNPNPAAGALLPGPQSERPAWWTFAAVLLVVACVLVVFMGFSRRRIRPPIPPRNPAN